MISIVDETGWNDPKFYDKVTAAIRHVTGATTVVEQRKPAICKVVHRCPHHYVRSHGWHLRDASPMEYVVIFLHCEELHQAVSEFLAQQRIGQKTVIIDYYPEGRTREQYESSVRVAKSDDLTAVVLRQCQDFASISAVS